ncbi:MAG: zinc ribbon domain-containing protein [Candidatus Lutacidiplasmatales archaeon]
MASLDSTEIVALVFVVVLSIIVAGLLLYLLRRLNRRRAKILSDLADKPELNQDRAFNRLAMARRESSILAGQGVDVHRAQELIGEAQGAFDTHQYDRAYRIAQSAHEALVNARRLGALPATTPLPSKGPGPFPTLGATSGPGPADAGTVPPAPLAPAIPKNRAESQFQIRILTDELDAVKGRRARDPAVGEAAALKSQASMAFEKGDYTNAFRLALRGRRALGGAVEGLPAPGSAPTGLARGSANGSPPSTDATQTAEAVAGAERCPDCGYPALAGDSFCRGCGRPRTSLACPSCGAPRAADEPFCGRCGARFP